MDKNEMKSNKISTSKLWAKLFKSASVERYLAGSGDLQELPCKRHSFISRLINKKSSIVNKTFVEMLEKLGYDIQITYVKKDL